MVCTLIVLLLLSLLTVYYYYDYIEFPLDAVSTSLSVVNDSVITWAPLVICHARDVLGLCTSPEIVTNVTYNVYIVRDIEHTNATHSETNLGVECGLSRSDVELYKSVTTEQVTFDANVTAEYTINVVAQFIHDGVSQKVFYDSTEFNYVVPPTPIPTPIPTPSPSPIPTPSPSLSPEVSPSPSPSPEPTIPTPVPTPTPVQPVASSSGPVVKPPMTKSTAGLIGGLVGGAVLSCAVTLVIVACAAYMIRFERNAGYSTVHPNSNYEA
jgi:hypothetical protein